MNDTNSPTGLPQDLPPVLPTDSQEDLQKEEQPKVMYQRDKKRPLLEYTEQIKAGAIEFYKNNKNLFGIDEIDDLHRQERKLVHLQRNYAPDLCSEQFFVPSDDVEKCDIITRAITSIKDSLKFVKDSNEVLYNDLLDTRGVSDLVNDIRTGNIKRYSELIAKYTTGADTPENIDFAVIILATILSDPRITRLSEAIIATFNTKNILPDNMPNVVTLSITIILTGVLPVSIFMDDNFVNLQHQVLKFIENIVVKSTSDGLKYELHDIIDLQGFRRTELRDDYCIALNLFYKLMIKLFEFNKLTFSRPFSSLKTHQERCEAPGYAPKKSSVKHEFKKFSSDQTKFQSLLQKLHEDKEFYDRVLHYTPPPAPPLLQITWGEGGSKSRRTRRRKRRHNRKILRKTHRVFRCLSKSKPKTHRRSHHSPVRNRKKYTYRMRK